MTSKRHKIWAALMICWGIVHCFIPLLNLLAFEFAFSCCIPMSFCAAHLGIKAQNERENLIFSDDQVWKTWFLVTRDTIHLSLFLLIPIIVNSLYIQNCNWSDGFLFFTLLPIASGMIAAAWGIALARMKRGMLTFTALFLFSLLLGVWQFIFTPVVDVFSSFMGYYPGAIYDEEIYIGHRLLWSRLEDLSYPLLILATQNFLQNPWLKKYRIILAALCSFMIINHFQTESYDIHRDKDHVQKRLGASKSSTHFIMYHPQSWDQKKSSLLLNELEFIYQELLTFFAVEVQEPIQVYFYNSTRQKKRLMGAGRTLIAKPWQYAIHVHRPSVGHRVIVHELAHVFSAEISNSPHHLSLYKGWVPHMSLIEGLAVAATWSRGKLTPHQWSAAMHKLEIAPPMQELLNPQGFYKRNSSMSYTLCGSFVKFYREKYGQEALATLYRRGEVDGGSDALHPVIDQWKTYLSHIELTDKALTFAKARFSRPSIFQKVCAHEIANLRESASQAEFNQDWSQAIKIWDDIIKFKAGDAQAYLSKINALYQLQKYSEGMVLSKQLIDKNLGGWVQQKAEEWYLDLQRLQNQKATVDYRPLIQKAFHASDVRRLVIKQESITYGETGRKLIQFLHNQQTLIDRMKQLKSLIQQEPKWSSLYYLYARHLMNQEQLDFAWSAFKKAQQLGIKHYSIQAQTEKALAHIAFQKADYQKAAVRFERLANRQDLKWYSGEIENLKRWHRRSLFFMRM